MYYLGIHNSYDSGAAIFKDGKCIFAINEERLSRKKMDDRFPTQSIAACLEFAAIKKRDVDVVCYAWHYRFPEQYLAEYIARACEIAEDGLEAKRTMIDRVRVEVERTLPRRAEFDREIEKYGWSHKVENFDHHDAHAASAFYTSPFKKALVITMDAKGNYRSASVSIGDGGRMTEIATNFSWDSVGFFYGQITELLGFKPHRHEGKVTGLAAYGNPNACIHIMREMISVKDGKLQGRLGKYYKPFFFQQTEALKSALKDYSREDIAAAVQQHFEDIITEFIRYYVVKTGIGSLALSGGAFANVKLNQRIRVIPGVKDLYVFPHMGDGGLSVGACLLSLAKRGVRPKPWQDVYLGNRSSEKEIQAAFRKHSKKVHVEKLSPKKLTERAVGLLTQDKVLGLFQGRMEYGPRALGNRSIIYHANDKTVNDWLNKRMHRTEFMPFAPVTTAKLAPRCFKAWMSDHVTTRFMTECYDCTDEMKSNSPAVVHVDGTARPQILERKDNRLYYDIIEGWYKKTGGLCLINTSFNEHEHPIVCTVEDSIKSLADGSVDYLLVNGSYLVTKK